MRHNNALFRKLMNRAGLTWSDLFYHNYVGTTRQNLSALSSTTIQRIGYLLLPFADDEDKCPHCANLKMNTCIKCGYMACARFIPHRKCEHCMTLDRL